MKEFFTDFGMACNEYSKYRPIYPITLFEEIIKNTKPPYKKAIDIGAGTGISTEFLNKKFKIVMAIEPDKNMAIKLKEMDNNTLIYNCSAEEFDILENDVDLVTSGNAFYWMNGNLVIRKIYNWLHNDGIFAAYRYNMPYTNNSEINSIILKENKKWDAFRHDRLRDKLYTIRTIEDSNLFSDIKVKQILNIIYLKTEELVGFFSSTSYVSKYLRTLNLHKQN